MKTESSGFARGIATSLGLAAAIGLCVICINPLAAQVPKKTMQSAGLYADILERIYLEHLRKTPLATHARLRHRRFFKKNRASDDDKSWSLAEFKQNREAQFRVIELSIKRLRANKNIPYADRLAYSAYLSKFFTEYNTLAARAFGPMIGPGRKRGPTAHEVKERDRVVARMRAMRLKPIKLEELEIAFIAPVLLKQPGAAKLRFYPIAPKNPLVFEITSTGDEPADEIQLSFKLSHGSIRKFTLAGSNCIWNKARNEGLCGFVGLAPGASLKVGVILQLAGLELTEQKRFSAPVSVEATVKTYKLNERTARIDVTFEDCASKLRTLLYGLDFRATSDYHSASFEALYGYDDYLKKRINAPKKTNSPWMLKSNAIVMEMLRYKGRDEYLANGAVENGKKMRDHFIGYVAGLKKTLRKGAICPMFGGPGAAPIMAAAQLAEKHRLLRIRAERARRQAASWRKAILAAFAEIGDKTGPTVLQPKNANEGLKEGERKVATFAFNKALQWLMTPVGATTSTVAPGGKFIGALSLLRSGEQILTALRDWYKLNAVGLQSFEVLAMIETAAHLKVLEWRYAALVKANNEYISRLQEIYKTHCSCRVPFE